MRKNNYNTNANGPDIELVCFMDTDMSRMEFDDNFAIIQHSDYRKTCKAYYIDNGNVKDHDDITFSLSGFELEIENALLAEGYDREEYKAMIEGEPFEILQDRYGEKVTILNYEDFNTVYAPLQAVPSKTLECVSISGYSQGDYAEVFYCPDDLEKCWGNKPPEPSKMAETFSRLFYDAPIWACFTINGEEYRYDELMDDSYEWEPEKFAAIVSEKSGIDRQVLADFLPAHPDYN